MGFASMNIIKSTKGNKMKKFKVVYQVNYVEAIYVDAENEDDVKKLLDNDDFDKLKVITHLKYDAELFNIREIT